MDNQLRRRRSMNSNGSRSRALTAAASCMGPSGPRPEGQVGRQVGR